MPCFHSSLDWIPNSLMCANITRSLLESYLKKVQSPLDQQTTSQCGKTAMCRAKSHYNCMWIYLWQVGSTGVFMWPELPNVFVQEMYVDFIRISSKDKARLGRLACQNKIRCSWPVYTRHKAFGSFKIHVFSWKNIPVIQKKIRQKQRRIHSKRRQRWTGNKIKNMQQFLFGTLLPKGIYGRDRCHSSPANPVWPFDCLSIPYQGVFVNL